VWFGKSYGRDHFLEHSLTVFWGALRIPLLTRLLCLTSCLGQAAKPEPKKSKTGLKVGDDASILDISLTTEEDKEVKLADLVKEKGIVIFMYPKANTGGWAGGCDHCHGNLPVRSWASASYRCPYLDMLAAGRSARCDLLTFSHASMHMHDSLHCAGGCTKQACGFKDNYSGFTKAGYEIYGETLTLEHSDKGEAGHQGGCNHAQTYHRQSSSYKKSAGPVA
jgi:peroxiredoxin